MENEYIAETAADFLTALDSAGTKLQDFSQLLQEKNDMIFLSLDRFGQKTNSLMKAPGKIKESRTTVDSALDEVMQGLNNAINSWHKSIASSKKGQQFMHDHEKYLVVMVFGAVKAGKSTLGNFIAGREWLSAPFDNVYKHCPVTEFATQEKGRDTGDLEKVNGRMWFSEGITDTTGDIQYFTLSGMRWFDSPGTGALSKKGDKRNMEEMVKEYLQYVDMCIFLVNSSEPGLMEDMKYIKTLSRAEQEALVVITKSDGMIEDVGDDGNMIKRLGPKTREGRELQENDLCNRLYEEYPEIDSEKFRAMSISTSLAKEALALGDGQKFRDSQLDILLKKLTDKANKNIVELKEARPQKAMNKFLQDIIDGDDIIVGIKGLQENLEKVINAVKEYQQKIDQNTEKISQGITRKVKAVAHTKIFQMAHQAETSGKYFVQNEITRELFLIAHPIIVKEINQEVSRIIGNNKDFVEDLSIVVSEPNIKSQGIRQCKETISRHYTEVEVIERDPKGIWENIRGFFGKHYYERVTHPRVSTSTIVVGTNIESAIEEIMPQIQFYVEKNVKNSLEKIGKEYFLPQEKFVQAIQLEVNHLSKTLEKLRF